MRIALGRMTPIYGLIVRGASSRDTFVTSYKLFYSLDDLISHPILYDGVSPVFRGPIDADIPVKSLFAVPIEATFVYVYPLTWHGARSMNVQLLGCAPLKDQVENINPTTPATTATTATTTTTTHVDQTTTVQPQCDDPMGIDNGRLANIQVSFSSMYSSTRHNIDVLKMSSTDGWRPSPSSHRHWVVIDFLEPRLVTGLRTKGGPTGWVTAFNVQYSLDADNWNVCEAKVDGSAIVFLANYDGTSEKANHFDMPIRMRYMKIVPTKWHEVIELKLEPIGCFQEYRE